MTRLATRIALLGALAAAACGAPESRTAEAATTPAPPPRDTALLSAASLRLAGLQTTDARLTPWRATYAAPARVTLDPTTTQTLGSIVEGRISRIFVLPGDRVRAGQVLVTIHSHEMMDARNTLAQTRAGLAQAENDLALASAAAARAERLYGVKALSMADLERARAGRVDADRARDRARAELDRAEALVGHLVGSGPQPPGTDEHEVLVRAPFDGVVVSRDVQPGAVALVGAPLLTVSRLTSLVLLVNLPEQGLPAARVGSPIRVTVATLPGLSFEGRVTRIAPVVDSLTRTVEVMASVSDSAGLLKPEMYANAELLGPPEAPVLAVPADAVQAMEGDTVVIAARQMGEGVMLEALRVRVGRRTAATAEIVAGLEPGTPIVVGGAAVAKAEILRRRTAGGEQ